MRTIHLHGRLGTKFGRKHSLAVSSPAEAMRALSHLLPGFSAYVRARKYAVAVGDGTVIGERQLRMQLAAGRDVHIVPAGAASGIETILLGATLLLTAVAAVSVLSMPKAVAASAREDATKTASFIFDGAQNNSEQGHPVPLVYGQMRVGSIVVSAGINTSDANAMSLGTNPANPYLSGTYKDRVGITAGFLSGNSREWVAFEKGGKGGGGGTTRSAQEDPNSLQSQATAKIVDLVSEGEIVGLVNGMQSIYFDGTPLANPDGTFNFAGVAVEQRLGLPDQEFMPGFADTELTRQIGTDVTANGGPVTRSIEDGDVTVARVTIRLPQLFQQDTTNGDLKQSSVEVAISVQADGGGFTEIVRSQFVGKTNSPYQRSFDIRLPNGTTRDVRVTRITPDSDVASLQNDTVFDLLTEVVEAKLSYPDSALFGLTVDAKQFGTNIQGRAYEIKGLIIEVPSNYNPVTRAYSGIWDGTFKRAWTDNPAWVFRDILVSRRYGLGARIPESAIDKWGLYAIAQYCDGMVPDGFGGTEPRYTINCAITNPASAYDLLASIASNFRGWAYWGSGTVMAVQDRPEDPSILVTPSNVVDGQISYGRITPLEKRRSVAVVYWNDPDDGYKLAPEIYEEPALIRRFGRRTGEEVTAFGVTRRGHAHRFARWLIEDESQASNASASYQVGDDHAFAEPGRIATIADPMYSSLRRGGRVRVATTTSVELDAPVTIANGQQYLLRVMLPDGTVQRRAVFPQPGQSVVMPITAPLSLAPKPGAVWTLETDAVANRQFRIRALTTTAAPYSVQGQLYDPTKYERVELDRDISSPNYLGVPQGGLGLPRNLYAFEFLFPNGTASVPAVQMGWQHPDDPRVLYYQAQVQRPGGQWEAAGDSSDSTRVIRPAEPGSWGFRVRSLDALGNKTAWVQITAPLDGQVDLIPNPYDLTLNVSEDAGIAALVWTPPIDFRPLRFEIMYNIADDYAGAASLGIVDGASFVVIETGFYWVRSTFLGYTSSTPPSASVSAADLPSGIFAAALDAITNDAILSGKEKRRTKADRDALQADANALYVQYLALGSPTDIADEIAAQDAALIGLDNYLATIAPSWVDFTQPSPIVPADYATAFLNARDKVAKLNAAITGRPGANGASTFTLTPINATAVGVDSVRPLNPANDEWSGKAQTVQGYKQAAVSGYMTVNAGFGLTTDPLANTSFDTVDYWFHRSANGSLNVYRNGAFILSLPDDEAGTPDTPSGPFQVVADGKTVRYLYKGVERYSHEVNPGDGPLFGVFNFANMISRPQVRIDRVTFASAGQAGSSAFNLIAYGGGRLLSSNSVAKQSGVQGVSDSGAYSLEGWRGGCQLSFVTMPGWYTAGGLNDSPGASTNLEDIDFAWHCVPNGNANDLQIFENGQYIGSYGFVGGPVRLAIIYNNKTVRYLLDGATVREVPTTADRLFYFDSSIWTLGSRLDQIAFASAGAAGASAIVAQLTNGTHTLPANYYGMVSSYAGASTDVVVFDGAQDVSADYVLSTAPGGNPQSLFVSYSGRTATVTGGFDASEDVASLTIRATGTGLHAGQPPIDRVFSLSKSKGGLDGSQGALISLSASAITARYNADDQYVGSGITFVANRQNTNSPTAWRLFSNAGDSIFGYAQAADFVAAEPTYWSSTGNDNLTLTPVGVDFHMDTYGNGISLAAAISGTSIIDTASISKVKDGTNGENGLPGADGFIVDTETVAFVQPVFSSGANKPSWTGGSGTIRLTKGKSRITSGVTYAVLTIVNIASLSLAGDTFSFAGTNSDKGSFTIRAMYDGVAYDRTVTVTKVADGEAAFRGSTVLGVQSVGAGVVSMGNATTTVPGGRGCTLSAVVNYDFTTNQTSDYVGRLHLYWRNATDNGPLNYLGFQDGSAAGVFNAGTVEEPQYVRTPGTVSASFAFQSPTADKAIYFEARIERIAGGGGNARASGSMKLEVSS
jgi:predicted phage tail protein